MLPSSTCPICSSLSAKIYTVKDRHQLLQCESCGFVYVALQPGDAAESRKQYLNDKTSPSEYYQATRGYDILSFAERLGILSRFVRRGTILDVGTNVGTFLETAEKAGWTSWGIEPNPMAARLGRERGLKIREGFFDDEIANGFLSRGLLFDAIHLGDVIEHVPRPLELLARAAKLLKPDGAIIAVTPDIDTYFARRFQIKPDEHLCYFSIPTLTLAFKKADLDVVYCRRSSRRRNLAALGRGTTKLGTAEKSVVRLARLPLAGKLLSPLLAAAVKDETTIIGRRSSFLDLDKAAEPNPR